MKQVNTISVFLVTACLLLLSASCSNTPSREKPLPGKTTETNPVARKAPSTYQDTLTIDKKSAVFYHPDSLQLEKIKATLDANVFDGTMHEYFYQMRNARIVINKNWPDLKIIEAKNARYLLFKKADNTTASIDLDTKGDSYGLFLFDPKKEPHPADMMNIEDELPSYFNKK